MALLPLPGLWSCSTAADQAAKGNWGCLRCAASSRTSLQSGVFTRVRPLGLRGPGLFTRAEENFLEDPLAALSPRELEVFSNLVNGLRAKDIADLLAISPKTVDTYRASLMRKLNVHDLAGLVRFAIHMNVTSASPQR